MPSGRQGRRLRRGGVDRPGRSPGPGRRPGKGWRPFRGRQLRRFGQHRLAPFEPGMNELSDLGAGRHLRGPVGGASGEGAAGESRSRESWAGYGAAPCSIRLGARPPAGKLRSTPRARNQAPGGRRGRRSPEPGRVLGVGGLLQVGGGGGQGAGRQSSALIGGTILRSCVSCIRAQAAAQPPASRRFSRSARQAKPAGGVGGVGGGGPRSRRRRRPRGSRR